MYKMNIYRNAINTGATNYNILNVEVDIDYYKKIHFQFIKKHPMNLLIG